MIVDGDWWAGSLGRGQARSVVRSKGEDNEDQLADGLGDC